MSLSSVTGAKFDLSLQCGECQVLLEQDPNRNKQNIKYLIPECSGRQLSITLHTGRKNEMWKTVWRWIFYCLAKYSTGVATCSGSHKFWFGNHLTACGVDGKAWKANLTTVFGLCCGCPCMFQPNFSVSIVDSKHNPCYKISNVAICTQIDHTIIYVEEKKNQLSCYTTYWKIPSMGINIFYIYYAFITSSSSLLNLTATTKFMDIQKITLLVSVSIYLSKKEIIQFESKC